MSESINGKVRIIGGVWKRTNIPVLNADGLRPTGDRQRETLFNWLTFILGSFEGRRSLDLFGGSGALSFEFLSRGGSLAVVCEKNRTASGLIRRTADKLKTELMVVLPGDCFTMQGVRDEAPYDVIFIDPPFALDLQLKALSFAADLLAPSGIIYVESPFEISDEALENFSIKAIRRLKTSTSRMLLAQKSENE